MKQSSKLFSTKVQLVIVMLACQHTSIWSQDNGPSSFSNPSSSYFDASNEKSNMGYDQFEHGRPRLQFCKDVLGSPGEPFTSAMGTLRGLSPGYYEMTICQIGGSFTITNLDGTWNNRTLPNCQTEGAFRLILSDSIVGWSGIVPPTARARDWAEVEFRIYDLFYRLVYVARNKIQVGETEPGWEQVWEGDYTGGLDGYDILYIGDFDGDEAEEILGVHSHTWMTMFNYHTQHWNWGWSNYGSSEVGSGIFDYRMNMIVGDFDGDGSDETLGIGLHWITMFHFWGNDWHWGWSNYGQQEHPLFPYKDNLVVGDFNGDGRDELLGVSGDWVTMFRFESNNQWQVNWSNYGNEMEAIHPYRNDLASGDFDGDGKAEVFGFSGWATLFHFENTAWQWGWSTYGGGSFGGWSYPFEESDKVVIGDIDDNDLMEEIVCIQSGPGAAWATSFDLMNNEPSWHWSNYGNPPSIGNWYMPSLGESSVNYYMVRAIAGEPEFLLARKGYCDYYDLRMYQVTGAWNNY